MKSIFSLFVPLFLLSSNIYAADLEAVLLANATNDKYLNNITIYGVGEKVSDISYRGVGFKYDSNYTSSLFEKANDFRRASIVQRIDFSRRLYSKLGLAYFSKDELISGVKKENSKTTYGVSIGCSNDTSYNFEVGYIENRIKTIDLERYTTTIWYTESAIKQDINEFGSFDATLSYQNAKLYDSYSSDYSASVAYYLKDDFKFGVKYDSINHDDDDYRFTGGINYQYDGLENFDRGSTSLTGMFTKSVSENMLIQSEYKDNIVNRSLKLTETFKQLINSL